MKLHLMVRLHCWRSGWYRLFHHDHNLQVLSNLESQYLLGSHLWIKKTSLKIICIWYITKLFLSRIDTWGYGYLLRIIISYLKPYMVHTWVMNDFWRTNFHLQKPRYRVLEDLFSLGFGYLALLVSSYSILIRWRLHVCRRLQKNC